MTKPPTFTECTICGREFGSKSIVIHERQCLLKLRRTEILQEAEAQGGRRNKKKASHSTAKSESNVQKSVMATSLSPELINLPKITTKHATASKIQNGSKDKSYSLTIRPTTATLPRPQILNPDYIQYDMSLTRIDYTTLTPKAMDENHNNRIIQRQLDDMNRSSNVIFPGISAAITPIRGKQYKGIDMEGRITKLPESTLTTLLGEPMKKQFGLSDDTILPRHSENFQAPNCTIPCPGLGSYSIPLPNPNLSSDSLKKAVQCPSEHDEKYNLPQITNVRTSDEPNEDNYYIVTPGHSASTLLQPIGSRTHHDAKRIAEFRGQKGKDSDEATAAAHVGNRHSCTDTSFITITPSHTNMYTDKVSRRSEQYQDTSGRNIDSKTKEIVLGPESPKSFLESIQIHPATPKSLEELVILKKADSFETLDSSSESEPKLRPSGMLYEEIYQVPATLHEFEEWRGKILADIDSQEKVENELGEYTLGDCVDENGKVYYIRQTNQLNFESDSESDSDFNVEIFNYQKSVGPIRCLSAPIILQVEEFKQRDNLQYFDNMEIQYFSGMKTANRLAVDPSINTVTSSTPPIYSKIPDPITQSYHSENPLIEISEGESEIEICYSASTKSLKSILKKSASSMNSQRRREVERGNTFTGSDSDDEGSCNQSFTQLISTKKNILKRHIRSQTRTNRSALKSVQIQISETSEAAFKEIPETVVVDAPDRNPQSSNSEHSQNTDDLVEELTELLSRQLARQKPRSRRNTRLSQRGQHTQEKVKDWLASCHSEPDDPVAVWEGVESEESLSIPPLQESDSYDSLAEAFARHYESLPGARPPNPNATLRERVVSGLISAVFQVRELERTRIYQFNEKMRMQVPSFSPYKSFVRPKNFDKNKFQRNDKGNGYKMTSPPLDKSTLKALKVIGKEQNKTRQSLTQPLIRLTPRPQTSPPLQRKLEKQNRMRPPTPQIRHKYGTASNHPNNPIASLRQTLEAPGKKIVQTKVKSCQVPERRSVYCQSSPPQSAQKTERLNSQIVSKKPKGSPKITPVQSPYLPPKSAKLVRFQHTKPLATTQLPIPMVNQKGKNISQKNNSENNPVPVTSIPPYIFERNKTSWVEVNANSHRTHLVYHFHTSQDSILFEDKSTEKKKVENDTNKNDRNSGDKGGENYGNVKKKKMGEILEKQCSTRTGAMVDFQKVGQKVDQVGDKNNKQIKQLSDKAKYEHPTVFPSTYSLMMPRKEPEGQFVNLKIIIRRKDSDGTVPNIDDVIPEYSSDVIYMIVDEEYVNRTSPNEHHIFHEDHFKQQDNEDDIVQLMSPKIVSSNQSTNDTVEAEFPFLTCNTCGGNFNCRELRTQENLCENVRNTNSVNITKVVIDRETQTPTPIQLGENLEFQFQMSDSSQTSILSKKHFRVNLFPSFFPMQ